MDVKKISLVAPLLAAAATTIAAPLQSSIELGPWSGAITPTSAVVKAKLMREGAIARLIVSKRVDFSEPFSSNTDTASAERNRIVTFFLGNLEPDTTYFLAPQVDGRTDLNHRARLRTFPLGSGSFSFAFASCARTASSNRVFTAILENQPLFYMNIGDFHYLNITNDDRQEFRAAYDRVLGSPRQGHLYRYVPFVYMWDDHDYGGNNSGRMAASRVAARLSYQEYMAHYPLAAGRGDVPIYQAFTVGRVRFILTDLRSERSLTRDPDDSRKSVMGTGQKAWFKRELLAAKGVYPLIFWVSTVPWLGEPGAEYYPLPRGFRGYIHHSKLPRVENEDREQRQLAEDHWSIYATERREIADFIKSNGIRNVCILHGDAHMLAADDGQHSDYATGGGVRIPVMCGGPLDQTPSIKGGPYSQGVYLPISGEGCFGLVNVYDLGARIRVVYSGRNDKNQEKVSLQVEMKP